ncbi:MAG: hypothetical protein JXX29_10615 [Deltaproteobacteria bacterium]|nr:hypothetical protein [Deltaproteobacteria bacterium]MBN2672120.1 hypothetical protein [Deltaproteobacteria bacterium]
MTNSMTPSTSTALLILIGVCLGTLACDDNTGDNGPAIDNYYIEAAAEEGLTSETGASITESQIVGTWTMGSIESGMYDEVDINADGSAVYRTYVDVEGADWDETYDMSWELEGSIFSAVMEVTDSEDGVTWTEFFQTSSTAAVVGDQLILGALIRTDGGSDGYDGTWKRFEAEKEDERAGDEYEIYSEVETLTLNISGDTFIGTESWEEEWRWSFSGEIDEGTDNGDNALSGTVSQEGEYLVLRTTDEWYVYTLKPLSNDVMLLAEDEPEYAEEYWEGAVFTRQ